MPITALIGDLGGTNIRLRLLSYKAFNTHSTGDILFEKKYLSGTFPSLESVLLQFLKDAHDASVAEIIPPFATPKICVVCVAGPCSKHVDGVTQMSYTTSNVTALGWKLDSRTLAVALSMPTENVTVMNDFEGVGYGILGLPASQLVTLNEGTVVPNAPIAVLGPGTGLGAAYLVHHNGNYHVCASEGGHVTYSPSTPQELALLNYIRTELGSPDSHVSIERVASGNGLRSVYRFVRHSADPLHPLYQPANVRVYRNPPSPQECPVLGHQFPARAICDLAQAGDKHCVATLNLFAAALGRAAGNLLVTTLPLGGLFIAGGMGAKMGFLLDPKSTEPSGCDRNLFLKTMLDKGRLSDVAKKVNVKLVLGDDVGMVGCAVVANRMVLRVAMEARASL